MCNSGNSVFILLVIWHLNTNGDSQLIGEEKRQVCLEQAMLERLRPILMETTRTLETKVGRLEEENRQMKIKFGNLEEDNRQIDPKKGSLEEENRQMETKVGSLEEENRQMETKVGRLEEEISQIETKVESLEEENRQMDTKVGSLEEENRQMETKVGRLEEEISQMDTKVGILEEENRKMETKVGRLEEENSQMDTKVESLEEENRQMETKIGSLEEENRQMETKIGSLEEKNVLVNGCPISKTCAVTGLICPRFVMDPATLHPDYFLSRDKLTLSNKRLDSTFDWPTTDGRVYYGVQGSPVITNQQIIYFETEIHYVIKKELPAKNPVFEVAFTTEETMGEHVYVGSQRMSWSISAAHRDIERVVLLFKAKGNMEYSEILSDKIPGTVSYLKLGFYINRPDRIIAVFDINRNRKIHTFTDVDGTLELWPVFGVFNTHLLSASIRLNSERNITSVPCDLF